MRLAPDDTLNEFRRDFESWLDEHLPAPDVVAADPRRSSAHLPDWARTFQREMYESGWLVPGWPPELGGRNATPEETMAYYEVITERMVPRSLNPQGLSICAASIVEYGTEDQKERYVVPTLKGEITWCLGMSEPNAGSDLASLTTRAEHLDGHFVVNGQKVWTSGAHDADFCLCYVRTDPEAPKHRGISVLIIDMRTSWHRVPAPARAHRPAPRRLQRGLLHRRRGARGEPAGRPQPRVDREPGLAAPRARDALDHERVEDGAHPEGLVRLAARPDGHGGTLGDDPRLAEAIGRLATDTAAMRCLGYRGFAKASRGEMSPEHMVLKLFTSEGEQRACQLAQEVLGLEGLDLDGPGPNRFTEWDLARFDAHRVEESANGAFYDGAWALQFLRSFSGTISGGTSEIQRNIVAERVLGLPRG